MSQEKTITKVLRITRSIAVVGLSSKRNRAGYYVPAYLQEKGYRIFPVNPYLKELILGEQPYSNLIEVPEPVDLVLIFQRSENVPPFVDQAIEIGAKAVWMQLGIVHQKSADLARKAGLEVVMDSCMLVEHKLSRFL